MYKASLPEVRAAGFYKIAITPEITAYSHPDLHDLRIVDAAGKEVPYLSSAELPTRNKWESFLPFSVIRQGRAEDGTTSLVLKREPGQPIEALQLLLRNTGVQRYASLSGSNDGNSWYLLCDSVLLNISNRSSDTAICTLPLPLTNYPYLQLTVFNKGRLPVEVLGAGIYRDNFLRPHFVHIPDPAFTQKDSNDHHSYLHIRFDQPYLVDRLTLDIDAPPLYRREAWMESHNMQTAHFIADHKTQASAWVTLHDADAMIVIANEDSPPLHVKGISAWQQEQYLIALLTPGNYTLTFADSVASKPLYDLRYYKDTIAGQAPIELTPGKPERMTYAAAAIKAPLLGKKTMWAIILLVLAGLIAATVALTKQINRADKVAE